MKKVRVVFEQASLPDEIEVIIRASDNDGQARAIAERIAPTPDATLTGIDDAGNVCVINIKDVVSVSMLGKKANIITEDDRYTVRTPLQEIENKLLNLRFVRISRYEIVNLDKIKKYDFTLAGTLRLELVGGMETWASRRNISAIRKKLTGKE